jgi:adenylate kinase family enzyme
MLSQAFCTRIVSVGQLLRGEVRSGTPRGLQVRDVMSNGELLQDSLVLDLVRSRITDSWDVQQNGWELVGFPRTPEQARAIASDVSESGLKPDCVIVLDRPDELCKEFALGRMTDSATGKIFHPEYAPPPAEIAASGRLVWRSDDNTEVIEKRIRAYKQNLGGIMGEFEKAGVPVKTFDNARSDLETFAEIAAYVEDIGRKNLETEGGWRAVFRKRFGSDTENAGIEQDVDPLCDLSVVTATDCVDSWNAAQSPYLEAVRRCNTYASRDFLPVIIDDYQVGWGRHTLARTHIH